MFTRFFLLLTYIKSSKGNYVGDKGRARVKILYIKAYHKVNQEDVPKIQCTDRNPKPKPCKRKNKLHKELIDIPQDHKDYCNK